MPHKDPEVRRAYMREYNAANADRLRSWRQEWERENAEHMKAYKRRWHADRVERDPAGMEARRRREWLATRGVSAVEYTVMLEAQGSRCAICGKQSPETTRNRLHIDHDHESGRVRGLLCGPCNRAIGLLQDDPGIIDRAAKYLRREGTPR